MTRKLRKPSRPLLEPIEGRVLLAGDPLRINAGGPALVDSISRQFAADTGFTGGQSQQSPPYDVLNTDDDALLLSFRQGMQFTLSHAIANGNYALWLDFAEPVATAPGQRLFDVFAEQAQVLNDFDIVQAAGAGGKAVAKCFDVHVSDGTIDLSFQGVVGDAIVSAIVLIPKDVPVEADPYSWNALRDSQRTLLSYQHLHMIGQGMMLYANEHRGKYPLSLPLLISEYQGGLIGHDVFGNPRTSTMLPRGELSAIEQTAWVETRNDYIYLGAGLNASAPEDTVLAYENPTREFGDIAILWGDGHVSPLSRAAAASLIGFSNVDPTDPPTAPPPVDPPGPDIVQSALNLKQLTESIYYFMNEHGGRYPVSLAQLYEQGYVTNLHLFRNPRGSSPLPPPADAPLPEKLAWIDSTTDYLPALLAVRNVYAEFNEVFLCENPQGMSDGINLVLGNGRVDFRETRWATESLRRRAPRVASSMFSYNASQQQINFNLGPRGISPASTSASDLLLQNLTTGQIIESSQIAVTYEPQFANLRFMFPGALYGALPDGNYRATLPAGSVADLLGNPLPADYSFEFFVLAGDADRDRDIDVNDLGILASNWQQSPRTFSQGDFDYNGTVDVNDLGILASHWQQNLTALAARPSQRDSLRATRMAVLALS